MNCPNCGTPDMMYYAAEGDEPTDVYECPDCGYSKEVPKRGSVS